MVPGLFAFTNGGFETGDLTGWTVTYGTPSGSSAVVVSGGTAPNTNGNLNKLDQGVYSCELYSGTGGAATTLVRISQTDIITPLNSVLQFRYAAVLDGAHFTTPASDAAVQVMVSSTSTVFYQGTYRYASSPATLNDDGVPGFKHLPWTTINIDLSAYIGTNVTVSFAAINCALSGHAARAYVDGFDFVPPSPTSTITQTFTVSPTFSQTPTITVTSTITPTFTVTPTITPTWTSSPTFSVSPTQTLTSTITPTYTPTPTSTSSISTTSTHTRTVTPTYTPTPRPLFLKLLPPSPNPSNGADGTWIPYHLSTDADVTIDVWTVAGERVRQLHPGWRTAGYREDFWDQRNEGGNKVASGIFVYRVRATSAADEIKQDFGKCAVTR